jgi:hypothetical protein
MKDAKHFGKAAVDRLYRGHVNEGPGVLFLDFDDIICLSKPYGGFDLFDTSSARPADLYERLWHLPAKATLLSILDELSPRIVITTSWLRLMDRAGFEDLFRRTGLERVAEALHEHWEAPADRGISRHDAIRRWMYSRYAGEPVVVLDDVLSGTGLRGSKLDRVERVVFCEVGVGLHDGHLSRVRRALAGGSS